LGTGCSLVQKAVEVPGQTVRAVTPGAKNSNAVDPVDVQEKLLRFADGFFVSMIVNADNLRLGTNAPDPVKVLQWKIMIGSETCSIASGPNAIADVLDMTVFVSITRVGLEDYWQSKVYGESAQPMLEAWRRAETNIWLLASTLLKPAQQAELRQAIADWYRENPSAANGLSARALGFAAQVTKANSANASSASSFYNLLNIDPLSGLDPVTRQIAETRLFAERALFVTQKMPTLLRWQTELVTLNAVDTPAVRQMVTNSTEIAASADRFARVAEQLPGQISTEREEIMKALQAQETKLTPLVDEVRQTLTAGSQMSTSLNTTIISFDALMKRFGVGEPTANAPPDTNSAPFNILDYGATADRVGAMARQVTELVRALDQTLDSTNLASLATKVSPVVQQAQTGGKEIVDYAFWKAILLIAIVLAAALIYRLIATRLRPAATSKSRSL
jgi:sRNA-binding carbon storage regulator CsrA